MRVIKSQMGELKRSVLNNHSYILYSGVCDKSVEVPHLAAQVKAKCMSDFTGICAVIDAIRAKLAETPVKKGIVSKKLKGK